MGTSTNAYLFYGVEFDPEELDLCEAFGLDEEPEDGWMDYIETKLEELKIKDIELSRHCHCDWPIYFIYTHKETAWRGQSQEITKEIINSVDGHDEKIRNALILLGLKLDVQPSWRLASFWG